jgi:NADH-quinone oxidoreductase subunit F
MQLTPQNKARFDEIVARYPVKRSALLPTLHLVQEQEGWLSREALAYVGSLLGLSPAQVHDTASFYTMFRLKPEGKTLIEVCTTLSCALGGAEDLVDHACRRLGVKPGETTPDGKFTVKGVECLAACGGAPAVQVNGEWLEHATSADVDKVIAGEKVARSFAWPKSPGEHILFANVWKEGSTSLAVYEAGGGYAKLGEWLKREPEAIVDEVKKSGLRGRGGAGFPTGMKWGFLPKDNPKPRYMCVNADESEPGTYKDRVIIERDPHRLIEGTVVSYVGKNILGTGVDVEIHVHRGAGSYECGEETALIESLEGKRGQPRIKPPFPAVVGLYGCPTIVNNVETLVNVPLVLTRGPEWFSAYGTEKNGGPKLYSISGHVARPGSYEAPMGKITLRELIYGQGYAQGMRNGGTLKAVVPGGSSTPVLTAAEIDIPMDFDGVAKAGSMLGSAGTIVMDDSTCMVWMAKNLSYFYKHESCGKCSPCREGTGWMLRLLTKIEAGEGQQSDIDLLFKVADSIGGKTVCPFGDAAIAPPQSSLQKFRAEFDYHVREKRCWKSVAPTFEQALAKSGATVGA